MHINMTITDSSRTQTKEVDFAFTGYPLMMVLMEECSYSYMVSWFLLVLQVIYNK